MTIKTATNARSDRPEREWEKIGKNQLLIVFDRRVEMRAGGNQNNSDLAQSDGEFRETIIRNHERAAVSGNKLTFAVARHGGLNKNAPDKFAADQLAYAA